MLPHTAAVVSLLMTGHSGGGASGAGEEVHATNLFQFLLSVDAVSNIFILKWLGGRGGARTADIGLITTTAIIWTALASGLPTVARRRWCSHNKDISQLWSKYLGEFRDWLQAPRHGRLAAHHHAAARC